MAAALTRCVSTRPISMGPPACLMEEMGDAPVPPSWPLIWMTSALALATPDATVPMPAWATSFTLTLAVGDTCTPNRNSCQGCLEEVRRWYTPPENIL